MNTQTAVFRRVARDHMDGRAVTAVPEEGVAPVVARIAEAGASAAVVMDADGRPVGIVTEQDVARRIAFRAAPETPVAEVMTAPVLTIRADDRLYHAIAFMRRNRLRHMPVVDAGGKVAGMLALHQALAIASPQRVALIDRLTHEETVEGLRAVKAAQVEVAEALFADSVPVPEIQSLLTDINNDTHRRVVALALAAMAADGWGAPPVAFATVVMGSGGRGESFLFPDQDNGFVLADYPDEDHGRVDAFFIELAERMTADLDRVGLPLCRGNVMAINPLWRKTLSQWRAQISLWSRKRGAVALQLADIFFDFRGVDGELGLAESLRAHVTEVIASNPGFLKELYREESAHKEALGLFNRLLTDREKPEHRDEIDLKYTGTLPLVESVRLLALGEGVAATSTRARIDALHDAGIFSSDLQGYLKGELEHITALLLRRQIADFKAGRPVGNHVAPEALSERERDMLVDSFKAIRELRGIVRARFTGQIF